MQYNKIIPIGYGCGISFVLKHLNIKKETSLFEWFLTKSLDDITNLINMIGKNKCEVVITKTNIINHPTRKHTIYINGNNIQSDHYDYDEYLHIFPRRADRFINDIKNNNNTILFVRNVDYNEIISSEMIDKFYESLININPTIKCKLLLVSNVLKKYKFNKINRNDITHVCIAKKDIKNIHWVKKTPGIKIWLTALISAGYIYEPVNDESITKHTNDKDKDVEFWK